MKGHDRNNDGIYQEVGCDTWRGQDQWYNSVCASQNKYPSQRLVRKKKTNPFSIHNRCRWARKVIPSVMNQGDARHRSPYGRGILGTVGMGTRSGQ
jgi:hypothetical protein